MSADKYPRLVFVEGAWTEPAAHGTHKAVPDDAIVIEADQVPDVSAAGSEVTVTSLTGFMGPRVGALTSDDPAKVYADALALLAIAEYLRANPPVDEAEVERLARALRDKTHGAVIGGATWEYAADQAAWIGTARRLYLAGVRAPEVTE